MLSSFRNMFRVPDLRNKILFTLLMIAFYRLGANVTVPGIDFNAVQRLQAQAKQGGVLGFLNLFSGGALTQMAVFALGIMIVIRHNIDTLDRLTPPWLEKEGDFQATVRDLPLREHIDVPVRESLIVELYSK